MAEHNGNEITPITYNTISAAQKLGHEISALVAGEDCSKVTSFQQVSFTNLNHVIR